MKLPRRNFLRLAAGAAALPALPRIARAQAYPARPITLIKPYAAGGAADAVPRIMADHMRGSLGQPIIIENVPGAGGSIGAGRVARAEPNGYVIGIGTTGTHILNGAVYPLTYDVVNDFEPIILLASTPQLIIVKNGNPAKDVKDLLAWLKANEQKVSQGHIGAGSSPHLCGLEMQNMTGGRWTFVPYRGAALAVQDLVAGHIDLICTNLPSSYTFVRGGQVKALAVMSATRLGSAPEIPTVDEAGLPGFHLGAWYALYAPRGTPREIIAKLHSAAMTAVADAGVRKRLADIGLEVPSSDQQAPEALRALQTAGIKRWWPVIKAAGIKPS